MKDFLAAAGAVLLIFFGLLVIATIETGGVQRGSRGSSREVLTWQGWQSAQDREEAAKVAAVESPPTATPAAPTAAPTAIPTTIPIPTAAPAAAPTTAPTDRLAATRTERPTPTTRPTMATQIAAANATTEPPSPWSILGWILVVLIPTTTVAMAGWVIHRDTARARAQVQTASHAKPQSPPAAANPPPDQGPANAEAGRPKRTPEEPFEEGMEVHVDAFLCAIAAPPGYPAAGSE